MVCVLLLLLATPAGSRASAAPPSRTEVLTLLQEGKIREARGLLDSLTQVEPRDAIAAYWGARAAELAGSEDAARCRYLRLESTARGTEEARLAAGRCFDLERREADILVGLGSNWVGPSDAGAEARDRILLLPLEFAGGQPGEADLGLSWTYLLYEALFGSDLCPVPLPTEWALLDQMHEGRAIRASSLVADHPVNTVEGLRGRLACLNGSDGAPYLETSSGGWTDDLEEALVRFQRDRGLAPTGEADPQTQRRLDADLETWLLTPPPPLDPKLLPRVAARVGAAHVVCGTYQQEGDRVSVLVTILDPSGMAETTGPISLTFSIDELGSACAHIATLLAGELGTALPEPPACPLNAEEVQAVVPTLLLADRGMPRLARQRWDRAPARWFIWPMLGQLREVLSARPGEADELEQILLFRWGRVPDLDPRQAMDDLLGGLGQPGGASTSRGLAGPGTYSVLGNEGLLHIHGEQR
jgi:hypothetical protein